MSSKSTTSYNKYAKKKYAPPIFVGRKVPEEWTKLPVSNKGAIPITRIDTERMIITCPEGRAIPHEEGKYYMNKCFYVYSDGTRGPVVFYPAVRKGKGSYDFRKVMAYGVKPDNIDKDGKIRRDMHGMEKVVRGYNVTFRWHDPEDQDDTDLAQQDVEKFDQLTVEWADIIASSLSKFMPSYATKNKKSSGKKLIKNEKIKTIMWRRTMTKDESGELKELDPLEYGAWQLRSSLIYWPNKGEMDTVFVPPKNLSNDPLDSTWQYGFYAYPKCVLQGFYSNGQSVSFMIKIYASTVWPAPRKDTLSSKADAEDMPEAPVSTSDAKKLLRTNLKERKESLDGSSDDGKGDRNIKLKMKGGSKRTVLKESDDDSDPGDPGFKSGSDSDNSSSSPSPRKQQRAKRSKKGRRPPSEPELESNSDADSEPSEDSDNENNKVRRRKPGKKGKRH